MDEELESFKTRIDLRCYAAYQSYSEDRRNSYQGSTCMRHPASDDKIFVKRDADGHFVYFSVRDDRDNGSIIDFIQKRLRLNLGMVRCELRPWVGTSPVAVPVFSSLPKTSKDRMKVEAAYARMQDASEGHPYLENHRAIPPALLALDRFAGRIRIDSRNNAVFPHFDGHGLSGYELKNVGFTGFASGGTKALWLSQEFADDNRLVLCEAAIDALSFAVLYPANRARYASIGGKLNAQQPELIRAAIARMPVDSEIVSAMDNDAEGDKLTEVVRRAMELSGRHDLRFTVVLPVGGKDFNDQLRANPHPLLPYCPKAPSVA